MEGLELLKQIIESTGLPQIAVERELQRILQHFDMDPSQVTLEDVRELLSYYAQEVLMEAKDRATV